MIRWRRFATVSRLALPVTPLHSVVIGARGVRSERVRWRPVRRADGPSGGPSTHPLVDRPFAAGVARTVERAGPPPRPACGRLYGPERTRMCARSGCADPGTSNGGRRHPAPGCGRRGAWPP